MSIIASCGHDITNHKTMGNNISIKDYNRDLVKAVSYIVVCDKCLYFYKKKKLILTDKQADKWLNSL